MLTSHDLMVEYCRVTNKWAVFYYGWNFYEPRSGSSESDWQIHLADLEAATVFMDRSAPNYFQVMSDGEGFSIFETKEDMNAFYDNIVGDDGPTKSNPYDGPIRIYALTCGPSGFLNENT